MKVKNIKGTSRYRDLYGHESWIDYWCKHRYKIYVCASCGNGCCHDLVGAHVQKKLPVIVAPNNKVFAFPILLD